MIGRKNNRVLAGIKVGDPITADFLNRISEAINLNSQAVSGPTQKTLAETAVDPGGTVWNAAATDITDETVTLTDSNGDTSDIERITTIVFTNAVGGETMTLNITYT